MVGSAPLQQFLRELQWINGAQRAMGRYIVVYPSPVFDFHSRFGQSPKLLTAKASLSKTRVEALHTSILRRASGSSSWQASGVVRVL